MPRKATKLSTAEAPQPEAKEGFQSSKEVRDLAMTLARGSAGGFGWLDVFEQGLKYAIPGRDVVMEKLKLEAFKKLLHYSKEPAVNELLEWCEELLKEIADNQLSPKQKMDIATDCAKELKGIAIPRMTTQRVDDEKKEDRAMVIRDESNYLPEGTEEL